eukprot:6309581-Karenia_brevis.AAC.1
MSLCHRVMGSLCHHRARHVQSGAQNQHRTISRPPLVAFYLDAACASVLASPLVAMPVVHLCLILPDA